MTSLQPVREAACTSVLVPHPAGCPTTGASFTLGVELVARAAGGLSLMFRLRGDTARVSLPARVRPGPADGLWRHTCFEAFVGVAGEAAYREFNFSPSGQWAIYTFRRYRERDDGFSAPMPPLLQARGDAASFSLTAEIPAVALPSAPLGAVFDVGLCAVIETADGGLSWWALRHPAERPDFHDRAGFVLRIDPRVGADTIT